MHNLKETRIYLYGKTGIHVSGRESVICEEAPGFLEYNNQ